MEENPGSVPLRGISDAEMAAIKTLEVELREHLKVSTDVYNCLGLALSSVPDAPLHEVPQARKVTTCLLVRITNDLRCIIHLTVRGYSDQACALAASSYEAAFALMAIGQDEVLAQEWINHQNPNRPFKSVRELTAMGIDRIGAPAPDAVSARWYLVYSQLCLAKHLNPLLQTTRGFRLEENRVLVMPGPDASENSVRLAWFALEHASGLALTAAAFFGSTYIPQSGREAFAQKVNPLQGTLATLRAAAVDRGWDKNPFPDDWVLADPKES